MMNERIGLGDLIRRNQYRRLSQKFHLLRFCENRVGIIAYLTFNSLKTDCH